jgi:hypothetical protein
MTDTITRIDYAAARERLQTVTDDPAVLAAFDHIRATGNLDDAFMAAMGELSLDWLFLGKG